MILSWNEIRARASAFANEYANAVREEAEAQEFEIDFLNIFGITRRKVACFEHKVKKNDDSNGYIDLFWKGMIMIEMKTRGKDLDKAFDQAKAYADALPQNELPKAILICDFEHFHFYDLENDAKKTEFMLSELANYVELFGFMAGYQKIEYKEQDPVNIEAAELMGSIHDKLKDIGYTGHQLEVYLVRLLFCLFADDTGIFDKDDFHNYIRQRTNEDGSDLAMHLQKIFEVLNKPKENRLKTLDEQLSAFPYVNGGLFAEHLESADFNHEMREALLKCCSIDWGKISPAIFGSMFQSVMNEEERHDFGAHYTSETNILKLIHPLFLDDLRNEFEVIKNFSSAVKKDKILAFHDKLASLRFLDPACGCGNFLVITYRELRLLELEVIKEQLAGEMALDLDLIVKLNVNQFYGIEYEEFPSQIAQVAMWLIDHQMNMKVRDLFGQYYARIPLRHSATIIHGNALSVDWESIISKNNLSYILGNPPFLGKKEQSSEQKEDLRLIFKDLPKSSNLDYVTCWYKKAAEFIQGTKIEVGFVSTNSICQGEQVPILWPELMNKLNIKINFAHHTFKWANEAKKNAAVFCIIIGFSLFDKKQKYIYTYSSLTADPTEHKVNNINAYLIDAPIIFIESRRKPICVQAPEMVFGSMPNDDGNLLLTPEEKKELINHEPNAEKYIRRIVGSVEFINNIERYCLWLKDISPSDLKKMPLVLSRIEKVREIRAKSSRPETQALASQPMLFGEIRQPDRIYLAVPKTSSEKRHYIPMDFLDPSIITNTEIFMSPDATLLTFGILESEMHMDWMRYVCGRLKSDYRYSASIVYNNFPWPVLNQKQKDEIESLAQNILDIRKKYPTSSYADLYDPNTMPQELMKTHKKLDRVVEKAYGRNFNSDADRVAYLFELYQSMTADLFTATKKKR